MFLVVIALALLGAWEKSVQVVWSGKLEQKIAIMLISVSTRGSQILCYQKTKTLQKSKCRERSADDEINAI